MREKKRLLELAGLNAKQILSEAKEIQLQLQFDDDQEKQSVMNALKQNGLKVRDAGSVRGKPDDAMIAIQIPSAKHKLIRALTTVLDMDKDDIIDDYPELSESNSGELDYVEWDSYDVNRDMRDLKKMGFKTKKAQFGIEIGFNDSQRDKLADWMDDNGGDSQTLDEARLNESIKPGDKFEYGGATYEVVKVGKKQSQVKPTSFRMSKPITVDNKRIIKNQIVPGPGY